MPTRPGYTLMEVMVTTSLLATIAVFAAPLMTDTTQMRVTAATTILASDIKLAQVMTLSDPQQPIVVRFDPPHATYWLAEADAPEVPILRDDNDAPYIVTFGLGRADGADGVTLATTDVADDTLAFNAWGGLVDFTAEPVVHVELNSIWAELSIAATTGTITETGG